MPNDSAHDLTPQPIWDPDPDRLLGKLAASAANSERGIIFLRNSVNDVSFAVQEVRQEQRDTRDELRKLRKDFEDSIRKGVVRGTAGAGGVLVIVEIILEAIRRFQP